MKTKKIARIFTGILAAMMLLATAAPAMGAYWSSRQDQAHNLADGARALGYSENHPAIKIMQDIWYSEGGTNVAGSYYYSARTGRFYDWFGNELSYAPTNTNSGTNAGVSYVGATWWDGQYNWTWDSSRNQYYRYQNGNVVWYGSTTGINANITATTNTANGYNRNQFTGFNFTAGMISLPNDAKLESEAKILACIAAPYIRTVWSRTTQAQFMWCAVNIANGNGMSAATGSFPKYDPNASLTDTHNRSILALARDVLTRYYAEQCGIANVGRILPKQYTYVSFTSTDGVVTAVQFKDANGTVFPNQINTPYDS